MVLGFWILIYSIRESSNLSCRLLLSNVKIFEFHFQWCFRFGNSRVMVFRGFRFEGLQILGFWNENFEVLGSGLVGFLVSGV